MFKPDSILKAYRVTEKATVLISEANKYTFEVFPHANRREVASAVEKHFGVKVVAVNIMRQHGKIKRSRTVRGQTGRSAHVKKAMVTLAQGESIDLA